MPRPSPRLRSYLQFGAIVLVAAALPVVVYVLLAYGLADETPYETGEAAGGLLLVGLLAALAVGLPLAFLVRRLQLALGRLAEAAGAGKAAGAADTLRLAAGAMENTSEGMMVVDENDIILAVNRAFTEITGYGAEEAVGRTPRLLRSDRHDEAFFRSLRETLQSTGRWQGEIWNRRKNGEVYPEWLTINRIPAGDGIGTCYVGLFTDISEQREKEERIRHLAFHDALTGLPNRSLLFDRLQHAILKAEREKRRLAVMFVDVDRFKGINDRLGHEVGDVMLQEVAKRLSTCLRGTDTVARIGGDEFVVLLEDLAEPEHAAGVAANLIDVISLPQEIAGYALQVGISIGIALYPEDGSRAVELMKAADTAMYAAKEEGKGVFRFFHAAMTERAARRLELENDLRRAVRDGELELHYQPLVRLDTRLPGGVEALVRWRHPERGLLAPGDFIPLAEATGIMAGIDDWVLAQACRQLGEWRRRGIDTTIAVNLSARQLQQSDLPARVAALAEEHGFAPGGLQVEVAETLLMSDPERYGKVLGRLREIGVAVAVDDFGTGRSGLAHLRRLAVDTLKIDRSLVAAIASEPAAQIVRATVAIAQILGFELVAEGVETREQAQALWKAGCPVAQGFLFARPEAADITELWLATRALSQG